MFEYWKYVGMLPGWGFSQGFAMAALARDMVAVMSSGELEERVRELEDRIGGKLAITA